MRESASRVANLITPRFAGGEHLPSGNLDAGIGVSLFLPPSGSAHAGQMAAFSGTGSLQYGHFFM